MCIFYSLGKFHSMSKDGMSPEIIIKLAAAQEFILQSYVYKGCL